MNSLLLFLFLASSSLLILRPITSEARSRPSKSKSQIIVMGFVYCDICSNNTFSKHSYFLPGAEVRIECMFKAMSPRTAEQISFSVNRTTNRYGVYKLEIPAIDGIKCAEDSSKISSSCQASLIWSSCSSCNVPGFKDTSDQIVVKSKGANLCIYSLHALSFRPSKKEISLCGN
ncbi:hypothetical protein TIFTF001_026576 [Ficus carica]|uniref:Pollen Ole e 1 allergen and extensin family protein n=1 Tax=Ficus carica TaxID=3494 RepID=A0AA88DM24_FICCA|nr:hypothetical protein TIFTF001_026576 [Ficus carica]